MLVIITDPNGRFGNPLIFALKFIYCQIYWDTEVHICNKKVGVFYNIKVKEL